MSAPLFIHVISNGDLWVSTQVGDTPPGTVVGTFKVNSDGKFQKIGNVAIGGSPAVASVTGAGGKQGKEVV